MRTIAVALALLVASAQLSPSAAAVQRLPRIRHVFVIILENKDSGSGADSSACCNEPSGPNTPAPGISGPGGGRVGAVLISKFIRPGSVNDTPYNHYSLLRSVEDLFRLDHLGYAGQAGLVPFGSDVYNCYPRRLCR